MWIFFHFCHYKLSWPARDLTQSGLLLLFKLDQCKIKQAFNWIRVLAAPFSVDEIHFSLPVRQKELPVRPNGRAYAGHFSDTLLQSINN
jgi:hypothetical protein